MNQPVAAAPRIAVLVDCDNTSPEALDYALGLIPPSARVVARQGYGNGGTLAKQRWREALNRHAFTPCLQYQFAPGKNSADIALALDALEMMLEDRADTFYLVTSDSDFAGLCRKLRIRGGAVSIVGEEKTPPMLQEACNRFYTFTPVQDTERSAPPAPEQAEGTAQPALQIELKTEHEHILIQAVDALAKGRADGTVGLTELGQYLRTHHSFAAKENGYGTLVKMIGKCSSLRATTKKDKAAVVRSASVTAIRRPAK